MGRDGDVGGYDAGEDVEVGDVGGEVSGVDEVGVVGEAGEIDEVGGPDEVRQLL